MSQLYLKTIESLQGIKESFIPPRETCFVIFLCALNICMCFIFQNQGTSSLENQDISKEILFSAAKLQLEIPSRSANIVSIQTTPVRLSVACGFTAETFSINCRKATRLNEQ